MAKHSSYYSSTLDTGFTAQNTIFATGVNRRLKVLGMAESNSGHPHSQPIEMAPRHSSEL